MTADLFDKFGVTTEKGDLFDRFAIQPKKPRIEARGPSALNRTLMSGMTFGWSDELAGLAAGIADFTKGKGFSEGYQRGKQEDKRMVEQFKGDNPVLGTTTQVVGGLVGAAPARLASIPATLLGRVGQGTSIGAGFGAVAGAGGAEGGAEDVALGTGQGAILGAGLGAALPVAGQVLSTGGRHLGNMLGTRDAAKVANEKLAAAIARDNTTPARLLSDIDTARAYGVKPEMLSDFGGENIRSVARTAAMVPGEGRDAAVQALQGRQAGQFGRIENDITSNLSYQATRPIIPLMDAQQMAAKPVYAEAYKAQPALMTDELRELLKRPSMQSALQRAYNTAKEQVRDPEGVLGLTVNKDGKVGLLKAPSMQTWDYIKRGIDDEVGSFKNALTGKIETAHGHAVDQTRRELLEILKAENPKYAEALSKWAGPARAKEVYAEGRAALREDSELTAREIAALSPSELTFFQAGIARQLRDMAGSVRDGGDSVARIFGTPVIRERIRAAFPDARAFANFEFAMKREAAMFANARTLNPMANSLTATRQADMAAAAPSPVMEGLAAVAQGSGVRESLMRALGAQRAVSRMGGYTPEVSRRLSGMLYNPDYTRQQETLRGLLSMRLQNDAAMQRGAAIRTGLLGGVLAPYGAR